MKMPINPHTIPEEDGIDVPYENNWVVSNGNN